MSNNLNLLTTRAGVMAAAVNGISAGIWSLASSLSERADRRKLADQLSALSDRELEDIGLTRGDIPTVSFWGDAGAFEVTPRRPL